MFEITISTRETSQLTNWITHELAAFQATLPTRERSGTDWPSITESTSEFAITSDFSVEFDSRRRSTLMGNWRKK
jgi:hypothetical protein